MNVPKGCRVVCRKPSAFTLVEVLVVLFIFVTLAAVALPTVRKLIDDQKVSKAARNIIAFIDIARTRAIAEGRETGVRFERFDQTNQFGRCVSTQVKQLTGVPRYRGDSSRSVASIRSLGVAGEVHAQFDPIDNQLLALSASLVGDASAPIKVGDLVELPGGRTAPISSIVPRLITAPAATLVELNLSLTEPTDDGTNTFPSSIEGVSTAFPPDPPPTVTRDVRFAIYRQPVLSSAATLAIPRGAVVDLNYSGVGLGGNEFAPRVALPEHVSIIFGPDGKVSRISNGSGGLTRPTGPIFLCVGNPNGVRPDDLLAESEDIGDGDATANLLNLDSVWIVINPSTGRAVASPNALAGTAFTDDITDLDDANLATAISNARYFGTLSDTLDEE